MTPAPKDSNWADADEDDGSPEESEAGQEGEGSDEAEAFTIEAILAERVHDGTTQYLIRWEGWDLLCATWEPEESFNDKDASLKTWREAKLEILAGRKPKFNVEKFDKDKARITADVLKRTGSTLEAYNDHLQTNIDDYYLTPAIRFPDSREETRAVNSSMKWPANRTQYSTPDSPSTSAMTQPAAPSHHSKPFSASGPQTEAAGPYMPPREEPEGNTKTAGLETTRIPADASRLPGQPMQSISEHTAQKPQRPQLLISASGATPRVHSEPKTTVNKPPATNFGTGLAVRRAPQGKYDRAPLPNEVSLQRPSEVSGRLPRTLAIPWKPDSISVPSDTVESINDSDLRNSSLASKTSNLQSAPPTLGGHSFDSEAVNEPPPGFQSSTDQATAAENADSILQKSLAHDPPSHFSQGSKIARPERPHHAFPIPFASGPSPPPEAIIPGYKSVKNYSRRATVQVSWSPVSLWVPPSSFPSMQKKDNGYPHQGGASLIEPLLPMNEAGGHRVSDERSGFSRPLERTLSNYNPQRSQSLHSGALPSDPALTPSMPQPVIVSNKSHSTSPASVPPSKISFSTCVEEKAANFQAKPPMARARYFNNYFANPGEILVMWCWVSFEAEAPVRGNGEVPEMWFKDICTGFEYASMCDELKKNVIYENAWIEAFPESAGGMFHMEEILVKRGCLSLFTPKESPQNTWLAYNAVIIFAVRSGIRPHIIERVLGERSNRPGQGSGNRSTLQPGSQVFSQPNFIETQSDAGIPGLLGQGNPRKRFNPDRSQWGSELILSNGGNRTSLTRPEDVDRPNRSVNPRRRLSNPETLFQNAPTPIGPIGIKEANTEFTARVHQMINKIKEKSSFHESFQGYGSLSPPIRRLIRNETFHFWSINLSTPLQFPSIAERGADHFMQRIFPRGGDGVVLFTENILFENLPQAVQIIAWFKKTAPSMKGNWKLVFWPNVMESLEAALQDPGRNQDDDRHICMILALIRNLNSRASCGFQIESLDIAQMDRRNHVVLCLPVVNYGQRNHHSHDAVPSGLTQAEINTDHLVEAFAGWIQHHAARFQHCIALVKLDNKRLFDRWSAWGHITINDIAGFFKTMNLGPDAYHDYLFPPPQVERDDQQADDSPAFQAKPGNLSRTSQIPAESRTPVEGSHPTISSRDPRKANRKT
ncbi:hypothetical protein N7468_004011 [Penicillium chermesinum]|uniref:Chromo domain-containing protein n=1 Tax=Penicillium chermesinum TaxID=63820 RepID=A0A9W9TSC5_9EURO|nr:uncharacterized protein N7468_004011 [Penicillium chermesinum]KAJ5239392.1 hypothetical protein N7468_004011 [Penicillium chermesinum]